MNNYRIIEANNPLDMSHRVSEAVKEGWDLHGVLIVTNNNNRSTFYQALTRITKVTDCEYWAALHPSDRLQRIK